MRLRDPETLNHRKTSWLVDRMARAWVARRVRPMDPETRMACRWDGMGEAEGQGGAAPGWITYFMDVHGIYDISIMYSTNTLRRCCCCCWRSDYSFWGDEEWGNNGRWSWPWQRWWLVICRRKMRHVCWGRGFHRLLAEAGGAATAMVMMANLKICIIVSLCPCNFAL